MNTVEFLGHYGGDEEHAMSAWTSTDRSPDKLARMPTLLSTLAAEGHHTPFEKSVLHFLVVTDTASHIHILKHRIGVSVNGESARYKEHVVDKYHVPEDWPSWLQHDLAMHSSEAFIRYHEAVTTLTEYLHKTTEMDLPEARKRAKESARFYLPYSSQVTLDVMFNFRSFMGFQRLRNDLHAQVEIRDIAEDMLNKVRTIPGNPFQHSLKAFGY